MRKRAEDEEPTMSVLVALRITRHGVGVGVYDPVLGRVITAADLGVAKRVREQSRKEADARYRETARKVAVRQHPNDPEAQAKVVESWLAGRFGDRDDDPDDDGDAA
jgi:hypothetical protein